MARAKQLHKQFGISVESYDRLFAQQEGKCGICKTAQTWRQLAVDHDHVSGAVRGLLCTACNLMLGILERQDWRHKAEAYLEASL